MGSELRADWASSPVAVELYNHTGHHADSALTFDHVELNMAEMCPTSLSPVCSALSAALQSQFAKL